MPETFISPTITVTIDDRRLIELAAQGDDLVDEALHRTALALAGVAQDNIRAVGAIDTGFMVNTTRARPIRKLLWSVGTAAHYGVFIEYGTRYVSPRPWLGPAMRSARTIFALAAERMLRGRRG